MKRIIKYLILGIIVIAIIFFVYSWIKAASAPKSVTTTNPSMGDLEVTISANGKISSKNSVELSFAGQGKIVYSPFKQGDPVKSGDVLAYLDTAVLKETENKAWTDYRISLEKIREFENNNKDKPKTDSYNIQKNQLEAQRDGFAALVAQTLASYRDKVLVASINGVLTQVNAQVGEVPSAGTPAFVIQQPNDIEFIAEVDEQDIGNLKVGQIATLNLDAFSSVELNGTVDKIELVAKTGSTGNTYYPVHVTFNSQDRQPLLGMNGDVLVQTEKKTNVIKIPQDVILEDENKNFVYLYKNGLVKKQNVELGLEGDLEAEVKSGLNLNDQIINSELNNIKDGMKVSKAK